MGPFVLQLGALHRALADRAFQVTYALAQLLNGQYKRSNELIIAQTLLALWIRRV